MEQNRKCPSCGGTMIFNPGFNSLLCNSCGHKEVIPELVSKDPVNEMDFLTAQNTASHDWGMEPKVVICKQCGGTTIQNKLQMSSLCPFCGSTSVETADPAQDIMAPSGVIPFAITRKRAYHIYKDWIKDRLLAPELLDQNAKLNEFYGIYLPLFTFDVFTISQYAGRGTENGQSVLKTGEFRHQVDDLPVVASKQLSSDKLLMNVINEYRTADAKPYTPDALAGFPCEHYSIGLNEAWNGIGEDMKFHLTNQAYREGISTYLKNFKFTATNYYNLKYKYLIVPAWINSFYYDNKLYTIVINGQTGKIDGQWPMSFGTFMKKAAGLFFGGF